MRHRPSFRFCPPKFSSSISVKGLSLLGLFHQHQLLQRKSFPVHGGQDNSHLSPVATEPLGLCPTPTHCPFGSSDPVEDDFVQLKKLPWSEVWRKRNPSCAADDPSEGILNSWRLDFSLQPSNSYSVSGFYLLTQAEEESKLGLLWNMSG